MTRKAIILKLWSWGFHDMMNDGKTLCAYEQMRIYLKRRGISLKEIHHLELNEQGEIMILVRNDPNLWCYPSGYFRKYESRNYNAIENMGYKLHSKKNNVEVYRAFNEHIVTELLINLETKTVRKSYGEKPLFARPASLGMFELKNILDYLENPGKEN